MEKDKITKLLYVSGMSCPNCEIMIENKLKTLTGVISIQASYKEENVNIVYDSTNIKEADIIASIEQLDYKVKPVEEFRMSIHNSKSSFKLQSTIKLIGLLAVIVIILIVINNIIDIDISTIGYNMGYGILFIVGIVTSLHCITMCGGINLSLCMSYKTKNNNKFSKMVPSLFYNMGRVVSYTLIGGIVGVLGSVININNIVGVRGIGTLVAGLFMILMGLNMINVFPSLRKFIPKMPKVFGNKLYDGLGKSSPFIIGLLNGLMPCGPLQSVQLYALGTGSFVSGALSMFLFSLGTIPAMFGFGAISSMLSKQFTNKMMKASGILVIILGAFMLAMAFNAIFSV